LKIGPLALGHVTHASVLFASDVASVSGPKFTDNLGTILRQFSDLRQSQDNWQIH